MTLPYSLIHNQAQTLINFFCNSIIEVWKTEYKNTKRKEGGGKWKILMKVIGSNHIRIRVP